MVMTLFLGHRWDGRGKEEDKRRHRQLLGATKG